MRRVVLSPAADRQLSRLTPQVAERVTAALRLLRDDPRPPGCLLLRAYHPPTWRLRVGSWRVLYEIDDAAEVVTITGIRHRSQAY